jgi:nitrile hydratase accessory protein
MTMPDDLERRTFDAPWHAQAFALAVHLSEEGHFSWPEWGAVFARHRAESTACGMADDDNNLYFLDWLAALEQLLVARGVTSMPELATLKQRWTDAFAHTPHGMPVRVAPPISD